MKSHVILVVRHYESSSDNETPKEISRDVFFNYASISMSVYEYPDKTHLRICIECIAGEKHYCYLDCKNVDVARKMSGYIISKYSGDFANALYFDEKHFYEGAEDLSYPRDLTI